MFVEPEQKARLRVCDGPVCVGAMQLFVYVGSVIYEGEQHDQFSCTGCEKAPLGKFARPSLIVIEDADGTIRSRTTL